MKKKKLDLGIHKLSQAIIKGAFGYGYGGGGPCQCGSSHYTDYTPETHNYALIKQLGGGAKCNNGLCGYCPGTPHNYIMRQ